MENFWKQFCRMCLGTINNQNFDKILNTTEENLDFLLLKLDLEKNKQVMCKVCALKIMEALKFKTMCLYTDNTIIPYIDQTGNPIDLLEIYVKEKGNRQLMDTLSDHKICRLCMQLIKGKFMSIREVGTDAIERYIPEINISVIEDPVICKGCFESINTHSSFLKNCLEVEKKIKSFCNDNGSDSFSWRTASDLCIKAEDIVIKQELTEYEGKCTKNKYALEIQKSENQYPIKTEYIDMKMEEDCESEANPNAEDESAGCMNQGNSSQNSVEVDNDKHFFYEHTSTLAHHLQEKHRFVHKNGMDQRDTEGHKSKRNSNLKSHRSILESKLFKCDTCGYKTREKSYLNRHMIMHKDISEIEWFECNTCDYKTKWGSNIRKHTLKYNHQGVIKNAKVFTCDKCDYKCKQKTYFQNHLLRHKEISEAEVFECDICDYKTKYKHKLKKHQLTYDDNSEFECYTCGHKTKYKIFIRQHMLKHKGLAETEVFKCDTCAYKTKYKNYLKKHQQIHKGISEFECETCGYRSKEKGYLRMHLIVQPTHYASCCMTSCTT